MKAELPKLGLTALFLFLFVFINISHALDITTHHGKTYLDCHVHDVTPAGLVITYNENFVTIDFRDLPPIIQSVYNYDPKKGRFNPKGAALDAYATWQQRVSEYHASERNARVTRQQQIRSAPEQVAAPQVSPDTVQTFQPTPDLAVVPLPTNQPMATQLFPHVSAETPNPTLDPTATPQSTPTALVPSITPTDPPSSSAPTTGAKLSILLFIAFSLIGLMIYYKIISKRREAGQTSGILKDHALGTLPEKQDCFGDETQLAGEGNFVAAPYISSHPKQLPLTLINDVLLIGRHTTVSFNRTLRIPEDGKKYNLPAGFGRLPIIRVEEVADRVPEKWRKEGGLIIPLYQREALFLEFGGEDWRPTIAKAAVGRINAITGKPHDLLLKSGRQDYVVIPDQQWLDGINAGDGLVKQFVAMPLGQGYTVEAQITDEETHGGFQLAVFDPRDGKFSEPDVDEWMAPHRDAALYSRASGKTDHGILFARGDRCVRLGSAPAAKVEMGIAAGGSIRQQILEDEYGIETWDTEAFVALNIHVVNSAVYEAITGRPALSSPITAEAYAKQGIPWFSHYQESRKTVSGPRIFNHMQSIQQIDSARGEKGEKIKTVNLSDSRIVQIKTPTLIERINDLRKKVKETFSSHSFSACLSHARTCGELLQSQTNHLDDDIFGVSIEGLAAHMFTTAGECSVHLGKIDDAEDFANRSLNLEFTEAGLSLRLLTRVQTLRWEDAKKDCLELLDRNPSHNYAKQIQTILAGKNL